MDLHRLIDHTLLKNTSTLTDFEKLFDEASEHNFFSVCIPPYIVPQAEQKLALTDVKICSVAGFPMGYNSLKIKEREIQSLYQKGCDEVDVVLNINNVKNNDWSAVEEEFQVFSQISKDNLLKVIIESGILEKDEILKICEIATKHPVSFLKTSTGFAATSARTEDVLLMKENIPNTISIKASGGIRNQEQALSFVKAGASRLGCSASIQIVSQTGGSDESNISKSSY